MCDICYYIYMIDRKKILSYLTFTIIFIAVVNILSIDFAWYFIYKWFDMPMHFLGGLVSLFLISYVFYDNANTFKNKFILLIFSTFLLGIAWEIYEYFITNLWGGLDFNKMDTISDVVFDIFGSFLGILIINKNKNGN